MAWAVKTNKLQENACAAPPRVFWRPVGYGKTLLRAVHPLQQERR
jgi:hypothetical protein